MDLWIILILLDVGLFIWFLISSYNGCFIKSIILAVAIIISLIASFYTWGIKNKEKINSAIDSGYEIYINGVLVNPDNINIDKYSNDWTIDDENKKIIITK